MIEITVTAMRYTSKPSYVAKLDGKKREFLSKKSVDDYSKSTQKHTYKISEDAYGLYEICDANYGSSKRSLSYLAVKEGSWEEFSDHAEAEAFLNPPPQVIAVATVAQATVPADIAPRYPGLLPAIEAPPIDADVKVSMCKLGGDRYVHLKMQSEDAFKLFMPEMKKRVYGRIWNDQGRCWLIPMDSVMLLREMIEERTIRANGMRKAMIFEITGKAKEAMAMD